MVCACGGEEDEVAGVEGVEGGLLGWGGRWRGEDRHCVCVCGGLREERKDGGKEGWRKGRMKERKDEGKGGRRKEGAVMCGGFIEWQTASDIS